MKIKKTLLTLFVISFISLVFLANNSLAYQGEGTDCDPEKHEAMEQAFVNNDYYAWKELMQGKGRVTQVINEENFSQFALAHQLMEEGNTTEANQIRQELGLGLKNGSGQGQGMGYGKNS